MIKSSKVFASVMLSLSMIVGNLPAMPLLVRADVAECDGGCITSFAPLAKDVYHFEYKLILDELLENLPKELEVTVSESEDDGILTQEGEQLHTPEDVGTQGSIEDETSQDGGVVKVIPVSWECAQDYDDELERFDFYAVTEPYTVTDGVDVPTISVEVEPEEEHLNNYILTEEERNVEYSPKFGAKLFATGGEWNESSYNAYEKGLLPKVRNQGSEGCCWAFASIGCVEADLIKEGAVAKDAIDLSELQLAYLATHTVEDPKECHLKDKIFYESQDSWISTGGSMVFATNIMANGIGLLPESKAQYSEGQSYTADPDVTYNDNVVKIKESYRIPIGNTTDIKKAIVNHGAVAASFFASEGKYSVTVGGVSSNKHVAYSSKNNSFYGEVPDVNHGVMLVGWDDDFPKENFNDECKPEGDGAWLVRNSWGLDGY